MVLERIQSCWRKNWASAKMTNFYRKLKKILAKLLTIGTNMIGQRENGQLHVQKTQGQRSQDQSEIEKVQAKK